ncbi:uncharacterized protein LDX57_002820 [Aspergillus melleus]|uniref:uncharacterized protein n=1 Tax=Aspergillus melleus TaxID=138277 RepID=UPI001E8DAE7D|nr:uncharacterized protein LDX57_002820 [Aspergillus melleus]KAH8425072.1 hypothetical protein LDX57_002820 [Aspergillus melleus]
MSGDKTTFQPKDDANCSGVIAPIRYRMMHTNDNPRCKKNPQPTADDDAMCGLSWRCGAFTGKKGMDFEVVDHDSQEVDPQTPVTLWRAMKQGTTHRDKKGPATLDCGQMPRAKL